MTVLCSSSFPKGKGCSHQLLTQPSEADTFTGEKMEAQKVYVTYPGTQSQRGGV